MEKCFDIVEKMISLKDNKYGDFQAKLTPGISRENIIGVRVPMLRVLARDIVKNYDFTDFLVSLPHKYYDENMLHSLLISEIKDYELCINEIDRFLPYVDNWAVCDIMSPKCLKKHKNELLIKIKEWALSSHVYTSRFGVEMLMSFYLDDDFLPEYLLIPAKVKLEDYYSKMMVAWFYATALAKQWNSTIVYIENRTLDVWTHNKTIQKAIESYRIADKQKEYLRTLRV